MNKNKPSLAEKVMLARAIKRPLPNGITSTKTRLPDGVWAHVFRHHEIGELGRLVILPNSNKTSRFVCEVSGEPDDPMTKKRKEILEPITSDILETMAFVCCENTATKLSRPYRLQKTEHCVECKVMTCEQCDLPTALLIFAAGETTTDGLEDHARLMYKKVKELNVPTWVIGDSREGCSYGMMSKYCHSAYH